MFEGNDKDNDDEVALGEANAPLVNANLCRVCIIRGVIRTNLDNGLDTMTYLLDYTENALVIFKTLQLQAPTFFPSCLLVLAMEFSVENPPICFRYIEWNLKALFSQYNHDGKTRCRRCLYIQHANCKNIRFDNLS
jgi:hypothetical protein